MNAKGPTNPESRRVPGTQNDAVLYAFEEVVVEWLGPFLREWMNLGSQPIPSAEQQHELRELVAEWTTSKKLPEGYAWLPSLLERLAAATRVNRHNLVNILPSPHLPSLAASLAASIQNPNNISESVSGPTSQMERESIKWLAEEFLGFDGQQAWGNVVAGGTVANMLALLVARDYAYRKLNRPRPSEVRTRGLFGETPGVILATQGSHYSVQKAAWFLGLGDENVRRVPVANDETVSMMQERDHQFVRGIVEPYQDLVDDAIRTDQQRGAAELQAFYSGGQCPFSLQPLDSELYKSLYGCFEYGTPLIAYVFTVGTTDTGTIERPSSEALKRLGKEDVFIHADAAAGGFALRHPRVSKLVKGIEAVSSATLDGHKLGHLAYPNACVIFREKGWVHEILHEAPYVKGLAPTLEGSRPGGPSAALWAGIRDLGHLGLWEEWLDGLLAFTDALVEALAKSNVFQVLHKVDLTTLAFAPFPAAGERRLDVNRLCRLAADRIGEDDRNEAFLISLDKGLSGIKVRDSNKAPKEVGLDLEKDPLVDLWCLRLVAANAETRVEDADALVDYLCETVSRCRAELKIG